MNDVIIGDPANRGNSAVLLFNFENGGHVSDNSGSYWIVELIWGLGLCIDKTSEEGCMFGKTFEGVERGATISLREEYPFVKDRLIALLISNLEPLVLVDIIDRKLTEAFYEGRRSLRIDIKRLLD